MSGPRHRSDEPAPPPGARGPAARGPGAPTTIPPGDPDAAHSPALASLDADVVECRRCPRLVAWREQVGRERRAAFRDETYWARPVPGFGDAAARILVVGLAPAAHGANRTGRMFTGDRSGDFLFTAMHRVGLANQPTSVSADDGLRLTGIRATAPVRCAPPANKPTPDERRACAPFLARELEIVDPRVAVVLGAFGWAALLDTLRDLGWAVPRPAPRFGHGSEVVVHRGPRTLTLLGCFHVSQQNTFTGRLTPDMLDDVLRRAQDLARD